MKSFKRFACLVTLIITCGHPLSADTSPEFREWVDTQGRKTMARFVRMQDTTTVVIERQDTKVEYSIPVILFSSADRQYVTDLQAPKPLPGVSKSTSESKSDLKNPDDLFWKMLGAAGSQPTNQNEMKFSLILELINQRFTSRDIKNTEGKPLSIRTEPAELVERMSIPRNMRRMKMDEFISEVARTNDVSVKVDHAGMIVLVDTATDNYKVADAQKLSPDYSFYNRSLIK